MKKIIGVGCRTPCVFGNLEDCIPKGTFTSSDGFWTKFEKVDSAPIYTTQYCYTHDKQCGILDNSADLETAGLPCWDYSMAGKRLQEHGPTIGAFLTHGKRHVHLGTPLILIENVKDRAAGKQVWGGYALS